MLVDGVPDLHIGALPAFMLAQRRVSGCHGASGGGRSMAAREARSCLVNELLLFGECALFGLGERHCVRALRCARCRSGPRSAAALGGVRGQRIERA